MNPTAKTLTDIRARAAVAIHSATGATIEITPARAGQWCVSGRRADVRAARAVMRLVASLRLSRTEFDAEFPGEQFDFYAVAA